ncbi:OTU domain-containing protein 3-like [Glandiceps talaboti]
MAKTPAQRQRKTKGQIQDDKERKRDERAVKAAMRKQRKDKSYLAEDENFASFATQLQTRGLQLRDIPGDGNCLFRALGDQLEGHTRNHIRQRQDTVQYMIDHRDDFEPFVEDDIPFDRHASLLRKPGTYAGNDAIVAFARLHEVNVIIHQLNAPLWQVNGTEKSKARELHISYHNGDHYSSVRKLGDSSDQPANLTLPPVKETPTHKKGKQQHQKQTDEELDGYYDYSEDTTETFVYDDSLETEQRIMNETGCQDLQLIRETLADNEYDVEATIDFLIQIVFTSQQTDAPEDPSESNDTPPGLWSESGSGSKIFGPLNEGDSEDGHQSSQTEQVYNEVQSNTSGARPKANPKQNAVQAKSHISNRNRKRQAKEEKKRRQMERHRRKVRGEVDEIEDSDDDSDSIDPSLLKDIQMLAI